MKAPAFLDSMAARVFLLLLTGIVASASIAFVLSDLDRRNGERHARELRATERTVDVVGLLARAPPALRPSLLGPGPESPRWLVRDPPNLQRDPAMERRLTAVLGPAADIIAARPSEAVCRPPPPPASEETRTALPSPPSPAPRPPDGNDAPRPPPPDCRFVALTLPDGERIRLLQPLGPAPPAASGPRPVFLAITALAAAALAYGVAALATAPLSRLSRAARALGGDLGRPALRLEGPREVRQAAGAFNDMQTRLRRHLAERTQMLAAITHDLQTPLTRMRLRLENVTDPALREALLRDQRAMAQLVREGLDLARLESVSEPVEPLDVDSLLQSLADDAEEAGMKVAVSRLNGGVVRTRPAALRRCLANLVDNAVKYGGSAELEAARGVGGNLVLRVSDGGPGIPEGDLASVLDPFVRLDTSRSRETGGVGLGLTIARELAARAGARLTLRNRSGGGLEARLDWEGAPAS